MLNLDQHPFLVPFDNSFQLLQFSTQIDDYQGKSFYKEILKENLYHLDDLQHKLYAHDKFSVLLIFQAMDAAGKDSTIRSVFSGMNPTGFQVHSFKQPSKNELDQDFLWRTSKALPQRGRIGIFNRSYYEEVLVVRVHPHYLAGQRLPYEPHLDESNPNNLWSQRLESIADHEKHLARNGTIILKFFLNVSQQEQHKRFVSRIENPHKNWKFSADDLKESALWDSYMHAYEEALKATSKPWAPWYAIPADNKSVMRAMVSQIIREKLESLDLHFPDLSDEDKAKLPEYKKQLIV
ncbi:MAG: polyphosphate kinase 2 family protein [Kangiellaceae bacterium]|nr:polyphosphate kinase 2 family protein [Kangiellaceae bacterium]